jgi:hypothetical protein
MSAEEGRLVATPDVQELSEHVAALAEKVEGLRRFL